MRRVELVAVAADKFAAMLDIVLFRTDQGGDPDRIRKSQKDRYADVGLVDKVIEIDTEWRKTRGDLDDAKKAKGITQKGITEAMKKKETPAPELLEAKKAHEEKIAALEEKEKTLLASRQETIGLIGNLLPEDGSVPVDDDEDNNAVVDTWGAFETEDWMLSHYDLTQMTGIANTARGAEVAGSRGYFLVGAGALLNQALISYAQHFLTKRGSTMLQTPFAMNKSLMGKVAQLSDYDETLYKVALGAILTGAILCAQFCAQFSDGLSTASQVTGAGEDQYLIATSEQPICAYHAGEWLAPKELPIRYAGYSTCFRKEAGSHGRDQLGIFRVHQFEKVEQFALTSPEGDISWKMQEEMIENSKEVTGAIPDGRNSLRAILRNSLTACAHHRTVLQVPRHPVPRRQHCERCAQRRGGEEVRPRGVVPGVEGAPRARLVLELHRLPEPPPRGAVRPGGQGEGRFATWQLEQRPRRRALSHSSHPAPPLDRRLEQEGVRPHAQLDALRHRARALLPPRELPDEGRRQGPARPRAVHGRRHVHPVRQPAAEAEEGAAGAGAVRADEGADRRALAPRPEGGGR